MAKYEWPDDEILKAGVEAHGVAWLAGELGVTRTTLRDYLTSRDLPTKALPKKLEVSDALKAVADLAA